MPVDLGERYRDSVTSYTGTATARTEFLHQVPSVRLTRADGNGKPEHEWFPEPGVEPAPAEPVQAQPPGFGTHVQPCDVPQ